MKIIVSAILLAAGTAVFAGCSGTQPGTGPINPSALQAVRAARSDRGHSWMSTAAKGQSLLYVSSVLTNDVYVYSATTTGLVGTLTGFSSPYGLCVDKSDNVWIVNDGAQQVVEYAHGGTTIIGTVSDPGEYPEGCSIDPKTGNLAVTNFFSNSGGGSVSIYTGATGTPAVYTDSAIEEYRFCGYDSKGNLYIDGATQAGAFAFAELPKGKTTFENITIDETIEWPGGVQWDGKYVAVGDTDKGSIYRVDGPTGKVKATIFLGGTDYVNQFWIARNDKKSKGTLYVPNQDDGAVKTYPYPAGGGPVKTIDVSEPFGTAISP